MLNGLISLVSRSRWLRIVLNGLHIRTLVDGFLRHFPLVRSLPEAGIVYRMSSLDSVGVAREIFYHGEYNAIRSLLPNVHAVADIGCNCGFFTCLLANEIQNRAVRGLLVDANPEMVREAEWHLNKNGLSDMRAINGLVGADSKAGKETFYVLPDASGSSRFPSDPQDYVTRVGWQPIQVPVVSVAEEWRKHFGNLPCDMIKLDIEGSEADFIKQEANFLRSARSVLIEIHHWLVDPQIIELQLTALGFELSKSLSISKNGAVRFYVRRQNWFDYPNSTT